MHVSGTCKDVVSSPWAAPSIFVLCAKSPCLVESFRPGKRRKGGPFSQPSGHNQSPRLVLSRVGAEVFQILLCKRFRTDHPPRVPLSLGSQDLTAVSESIFRRLPLGAGPILGVYVTVLVTTSRMCRMLDLVSLLVGPLALDVPVGPSPGVSGAAGRFEPEVSANFLDLRAASQSKGDFTEAALRGDLGE